jgi:hypothetical protein
MPGRVIDLDAARAARAEAAKETPVIRFAGRDWNLPSELPWALAEVAAGGNAESAIAAVKSLLGSQWAEFLEANPTIEDMRILLENVASIYVADPGKSAGSPA